MILTIVAAFALTFAVSLPVDWARRRGAALLAGTGAVLSVAGIMAAIYLAGRLGTVEGFAGVVALVLSVTLAGVAGDALATRLWGPARLLV